MSWNLLANGVVWAGLIAVVLWLSRPRVRQSRLWRATVTPLASIIGSGFLVLAPLLVREFGNRAVVAMGVLCLLAYAVGAAIRCNILARDRIADSVDDSVRLEWLSAWALAFAYVISVCYYLNLFGAFALSLTPWSGKTPARWLTTAVLLGIAGLGWWRGLRGLERAETVTVSLKLAVIAGLLAGMALYGVQLSLQHRLPDTHGWPLSMHSLLLLFGMVITVQGFETSRYLGAEYDAATRVRSMRLAQWLSTVIYLLYIGLAGWLFQAGSVGAEETAVIGMMAPVASSLATLLVIAALAAQFSAAVADTNGCGGLVQERTGGRIPSRHAYLLLALAGVGLTWMADIYHIISYASRAFAFYYTLQCLQAAGYSRRAGQRGRTVAFTALALLMLLATLFGIPVE